METVWTPGERAPLTTPIDTPLWRDPLSLSFQAHRQVLLLKLRWHGRRDDRPATTAPPRRRPQRHRRRP